MTLRARQGTHALLTLRARFLVSLALSGSLPEAEVFIERVRNRSSGQSAVVCQALFMYRTTLRYDLINWGSQIWKKVKLRVNEFDMTAYAVIGNQTEEDISVFSILCSAHNRKTSLQVVTLAFSVRLQVRLRELEISGRRREKRNIKSWNLSGLLTLPVSYSKGSGQ